MCMSENETETLTLYILNTSTQYSTVSGSFLFIQTPLPFKKKTQVTSPPSFFITGVILH